MFHVLSPQQLEPRPLLCEVTTAIGQLKTGKSPGLHNTPSELLQNTGHTGILALHHQCPKIWESCQWPDDWKLQEFVMLHKSGDPKGCFSYRIVGLISRANKILLLIVLNNKNQSAKCIIRLPSGYKSNRGATDRLFVLELLTEKIRNTEEVFITSIDYSKAFNSAIHKPPI